VAVTKAQRRRDERAARSLPIPRFSATGLTEVAAAEWRSWWRGGWASLWSEVEVREARELLTLIDDFQRAEEAKERFRYAPVIRAGRKRLRLDRPSPLPDTSTDDAPSPAKRKDPRV